MSTKKPGFTFARHQQVGPELAKAHNLIRELWCEVSKAYGKTSKVGRSIFRLTKAMDGFTSDLDDCIHREVQGVPELFDVYYPEWRLG